MTVWPHVGGRSFYCPACQHGRRHPPSDPELRMEGHACCEFCLRFMRIEGARTPSERPARAAATAEVEGRNSVE